MPISFSLSLSFYVAIWIASGSLHTLKSHLQNAPDNSPVFSFSPDLSDNVIDLAIIRMRPT